MLRGAIQRPIAVSMLFAALLLIGFLSYSRLPVDLLPSITYPRLTVITTYDDIPAEDLERLVTQPIEEIITALSGVRGVTSRTREGISAITVEYEWGTQMDFANLHLRAHVSRAFRRAEYFPEVDCKGRRHGQIHHRRFLARRYNPPGHGAGIGFGFKRHSD